MLFLNKEKVEKEFDEYFKYKSDLKDKELRDWFAGMALQGLIASCANPNSLTAPTDESDFIHFTKSAYSYADAMMEARKK